MTATRRKAATIPKPKPKPKPPEIDLAELARSRGGRVLGVNMGAIGHDDGEMYSNTIVIPGWKPPTLNSTMRGTIRDRIRHGKSCRRVIAAAALGVARARTARRVTLSITFPNRRHLPDVDSFSKVVLDALVHAKMLLDDSYAFVEWMPPIYEIGDRLETAILLEDIPIKVLTSPKKPRKGRATAAGGAE